MFIAREKELVCHQAFARFHNVPQKSSFHIAKVSFEHQVKEHFLRFMKGSFILESNLVKEGEMRQE